MTEAQDLARLVQDSQAVLVFSGAGISTESGIPDFRSPGGIWDRYDPREMTFEKYVADPGVRRLVWQLRAELAGVSVHPNAAHRAVAALEAGGRGLGVVTQNIDGLHQDAGSSRVVELHGTAREVMCIGARPCRGTPEGCGFRASQAWALRRVDDGDEDPACPHCHGLIKSATISFGQMLDADTIAAAQALAQRADLVIAVGSSLQVFPAADLPLDTLAGGGRLAVVNDEPTPLDGLAHVVVRGRAAEVLPTALGGVTENRCTAG